MPLAARRCRKPGRCAAIPQRINDRLVRRYEQYRLRKTGFPAHRSAAPCRRVGDVADFQGPVRDAVWPAARMGLGRVRLDGHLRAVSCQRCRLRSPGGGHDVAELRRGTARRRRLPCPLRRRRTAPAFAQWCGIGFDSYVGGRCVSAGRPTGGISASGGDRRQVHPLPAPWRGGRRTRLHGGRHRLRQRNALNAGRHDKKQKRASPMQHGPALFAVRPGSAWLPGTRCNSGSVGVPATHQAAHGKQAGQHHRVGLGLRNCRCLRQRDL